MLLPETSVVYRSARSARSRLFQPEPLSPLTTRGRGKYRRASWARCCSCLEAPKVDRDHRPAPICQMHLIRVGPYISTIEAFQQVRPYILHITLHRRRSWREKILPPQSFSHRGQMAFRIYIPATRKLWGLLSSSQSSLDRSELGENVFPSLLYSTSSSCSVSWSRAE